MFIIYLNIGEILSQEAERSRRKSKRGGERRGSKNRERGVEIYKGATLKGKENERKMKGEGIYRKLIYFQ